MVVREYLANSTAPGIPFPVRLQANKKLEAALLLFSLFKLKSTNHIVLYRMIYSRLLCMLYPFIFSYLLEWNSFSIEKGHFIGR